MARVAVTGASGFVGSHLLPTLKSDGHEVRGLKRATSGDGGTPSAARGDFVGDVRNRDAVSDLVQGCDTVIHLAASFSPDEPIEDIVVRGTRTLLEASRDAGVKRFIYVGCLGSEAAAHSAFLRGKWKAEQLVRGSELQYVILRPSLILGNGDGVTKPLAGLIRALPAIPIPGKGLTRSQPVDVADVVRCIQIATQTEDLLGESVSIGGPMFLTYRELVDLLAGQLGVVKSKILVPEAWIPLISGMLPPATRSLFSQPRLSVFHSGIVSSPGIVRKWFGFEPRSVVPKLASYLA